MHRPLPHPEGKKHQNIRRLAQTAGRTVLDFWHKLNHDWIFYLAAILAYTLLMSIIPLLAFLLSVLTSVLGALAPQVQEQLLTGVGKLILPPSISSKLLQPAVQTARGGSGWFGIIALLVSAWIGSRLFVAIEHCFSMIFRVPKRAVIRKNLMALGMLLVFALLLPLLLAVPLGMSILSSKIANQVLGNAAPTAGHPQEKGQANSPGLDIAVASPADGWRLCEEASGKRRLTLRPNFFRLVSCQEMGGWPDLLLDPGRGAAAVAREQ